ncbi:hypothetical protein F4860DRAFT_510208 [Xylaria cubensis]|nr:hypothetical protein F4860DRAFT_510208 [Xylaria cubensis]
MRQDTYNELTPSSKEFYMRVLLKNGMPHYGVKLIIDWLGCGVTQRLVRGGKFGAPSINSALDSKRQRKAPAAKSKAKATQAVAATQTIDDDEAEDIKPELKMEQQQSYFDAGKRARGSTIHYR